MKHIAFTGLALMTLVCGLRAGGPPDKLALTDLVNRPDRWPASVSFQADFTLNNGTVIHPGDKLRVVKFDGTRMIVVTAGNLAIGAKAEDCSLLDAANQAWSALTVAQRAIEPETLSADMSLWPVRVTLTGPIRCSFGNLPAGTEVGVATISNKNVDIVWPESANYVSVSFVDTDAIKRARQLILVEREKRPSRIAPALQGVMVDADGKPVRDGHLEEKKFFAFYYGAGWCAPCHEFTPDFVKFTNAEMPKHPELAVVMLNEDKTPGQMFAYMKEEKMPFPAVSMKDQTSSRLLSSYASKLIPQLVIVDRFGKLLATSDDDHGNRLDPKDTMAVLAKLLAK